MATPRCTTWPRRCQWPMWRDGKRPGPRPRFCAAPAQPGRAWCAVHAAIALEAERRVSETATRQQMHAAVDREAG